jgi:hypothetical protein
MRITQACGLILPVCAPSERPAGALSPGEELLSAVERIYGELEDCWAEVIGASHVRSMRGDLIRVLADPSDGQLPPVRPPDAQLAEPL